MTDAFALKAAAIFDGEAWHRDAALVVRGGLVDSVVAVVAVALPVRPSTRTPVGLMPPPAEALATTKSSVLMPATNPLTSVNG